MSKPRHPPTQPESIYLLFLSSIFYFFFLLLLPSFLSFLRIGVGIILHRPKLGGVHTVRPNFGAEKISHRRRRRWGISITNQTMRVNRVFRKWDSLSPPPPPLYYEAPQQRGVQHRSVSLSLYESLMNTRSMKRRERESYSILWKVLRHPHSKWGNSSMRDIASLELARNFFSLSPLSLSLSLCMYTDDCE